MRAKGRPGLGGRHARPGGLDGRPVASAEGDVAAAEGDVAAEAVSAGALVAPTPDDLPAACCDNAGDWLVAKGNIALACPPGPERPSDPLDNQVFLGRHGATDQNALVSESLDIRVNFRKIIQLHEHI